MQRSRVGNTALLAGLWLALGGVAHAQTYSRTEVIAYHDNTTKWVLGQTASVTCAASVPTSTACDGDVVSSATFDPTTAQQLTTSSFGKLQQTLTYNADGTIATVKDGNNNVTTLSNWKRGIPQSIHHPATPESLGGATESAIVDDNGWITSVTDENGYVTGYGYDAMGRLASIVYPSGDNVAWNTETFTFTPVAANEHGLAPGHWTMRRRLGNLHVNTYYDALWRPVLEESLDYNDINGTLSQVVKRYDAEGRVVFQSYPKRWVDAVNESQGTHTSYDALGRVTSVSQDTELSPSLQVTLTEYLPGFQTRVTNPRGYQTLTSYQTFDQPSYDAPVAINHPEGAYTEIFRDALGKPTAIRRRNGDASQNVWRYYVYDGYQQLCKSIEPETGATVMDYDGAGNLAWSAAGMSLPDAGNCNLAEGWGGGRRTSRSYDARNRLTALTFADSRGNQTWTYTPDGLPSQIKTYNDANNGAEVTNNYYYNKRRLLTSENVTQPGWYTWWLGYGYTTNGQLASQSYPTGLTVTYSPNALGQPTAVASTDGWTYASGVSYYPNGSIKQFTYGNGLTHTMTQNARQLPARVTDGGGALDYDYGYDANGNVDHVYDYIPGLTPGSTPKHRWMNYDGLDRLTAVGSAIFGGDHWHRFTYDALDNLKSWKLAGVKDYAEYLYDARNQVVSIKNSSNATVVGLGYDGQGNLQNKNGQIYYFDYGNRLRESHGKEWYRYDGHGRRVLTWRYTEPGIVSMYSQSGQLLYDENYRAVDRKATEYIYLAGSLINTRARNVDTSAWTVSFQHTDALGSPVAVTNTAGAVIDRTDWEPYGAAINKPNYDGIGFTGHVQDSATGLTYMQQRYYDPICGCFLSVDPVTAYEKPLANFNRYAYARNNPYRFTDPDGRDSASCYSDGGCGHGNSFYASRETLGAIADFLPVVGDIKGFVDFAQNPTLVNGVAAGVGLFGPLGDAAGKVIKGADRLGNAVRAGHNGVEGPVKLEARTTRTGESAAKITYPDGSVKDVSTSRVKEYVPQTHPNAPPGTMQRVKFEDSQPGTKGYKREPTPKDLKEAGINR